MRVVVPFAADRPKTRLAGVLAPDERVAFSQAMLADVLDAVLEAGHDPEVLATTPLGCSSPADPVASVPVSVDDRALTPAVNAVLDELSEPGEPDEPIAVVMADLALATPAALSRLFDADGGVVLVPGRGGGTNAVLSRHPEFRVDYHGTSYLDHRSRARAIGASVETVDSFRLVTDIDEAADLPEVLLHADNRAEQWLREAGFSPAVTDGRVGIERSDDAP
ncbi:2-phospho-L-lactate guanylyltransferase [Halobacteriales archaeon QS_8_65_32]|jgi:2-phospho-L-lactate guanylyltransferase|nr:MAG: 2-phospho-L-lactate guanylyltransferase [Halobacteriales archaeon QS_8_65_32]